jgi:hypothetical protein
MAQPLCTATVSRRALQRLLLAAAACSLPCALLGAQLAPLPAGQPTEYQVKAAFLLNFTKFIEWPVSDQPASSAPFTICILGEDPFGPALDQIIEGETANGQRIAVQRSRREPVKNCQLLYVDKAERGIPEILTNVGRGVLTVGEGENFLREGGMIAFVLENRRVRFNINLPAARNASLKFSSKLLNVAKVVEQ